MPSNRETPPAHQCTIFIYWLASLLLTVMQVVVIVKMQESARFCMMSSLEDAPGSLLGRHDSKIPLTLDANVLHMYEMPSHGNNGLTVVLQVICVCMCARQSDSKLYFLKSNRTEAYNGGLHLQTWCAHLTNFVLVGFFVFVWSVNSRQKTANWAALQWSLSWIHWDEAVIF